MARLRPKNWKGFQHYTDRAPPWIKLHKKLLDDYAFSRLPLASRALAPMLWLLASEDKDGWFDADPDVIAFRVHASPKEVRDAIKALIEADFLEMERDASTPLADCLHDATTERETQVQTETETETDSPRAVRAEFEERFWPIYPRKVAKGAALKAWMRARRSVTADEIVAGAVRFGRVRTGEDPKFTPHASTWLNGQQWADETSQAPPALRLVSVEVEAQERENLKRMGLI